jgi:hypothetical protein
VRSRREQNIPSSPNHSNTAVKKRLGRTRGNRARPPVRVPEMMAARMTIVRYTIQRAPVHRQTSPLYPEGWTTASSYRLRFRDKSWPKPAKIRFNMGQNFKQRDVARQMLGGVPSPLFCGGLRD